MQREARVVRGRAALARDARMLAALAAFAKGRVSVEAARGVLGWLDQVAPVAGPAQRSVRRLGKRRLQNAMIAAGVVPDGRGRWAVDEVLRVERRIALPGEEGRTGEWQRMALIRWRGADRLQRQAHVETWRPFEFVTLDLQRRWIKPRGPAQPKRERPTHQQDGRVTKRSPRLMGDAAEAGL